MVKDITTNGDVIVLSGKCGDEREMAGIMDVPSCFSSDDKTLSNQYVAPSQIFAHNHFHH